MSEQRHTSAQGRDGLIEAMRELHKESRGWRWGEARYFKFGEEEFYIDTRFDGVLRALGLELRGGVKSGE